jgi:hypothetical protein
MKPKHRFKIFEQPDRPNTRLAPWANIWVRASTDAGYAWLALESFADYANLSQPEPCELPPAVEATELPAYIKTRYLKKVEQDHESIISESLH